LFARGLRRRKEIAIRLALGAGRARLIRQLLVESVVLTVAGGAAGLIVAAWATTVLRGFFGVSYVGSAVSVDLSLDLRVVAAGFVLALVTGVLTGLAPALQATRPDTLPALKDDTGGATARRSTLRDALIVVQVAVSVVLLAASGLLVRSFITLHRGPGFDPDAVVLLRLRPSLVGYSNERAWAYQRETIRRLEALPGVAAASPANVPPLPGWGRPSKPIQLAGDTGDKERAFKTSTTHVGPRYFKTLGAGVIEGREFDDRDTPGGPRVAILNETLARHLFPQGSAVGSRLTIGDEPHDVVGVVRDPQFLSVLEQPEPIAYLDFWQQDRTDNWSSDSQTHVRVSGSAAAMISEIRRAIAAVDPDVPATEPQSLGARLDYAFFKVRAARTLLLIFGALALVLSAIGLYATLGFAVAQRTREIAIRMALGATRSDVGRLVMQRGTVIVSLGVTFGLAASAVAGPLLASLLYGVSPRDPLALVAGPCLLGAVALVAIWLPARRAMAMDARSALRWE
jgi:predicted permease